MALRALSLCAGIGGIDLGLRGIARTVCYVEREAFSAAHLVHAIETGRLDQAPIWSDLRAFDASAWRGRVDLVTGGYPCQPFSCAGKRLGADDPRHLWPSVLRVLEESEAPLGFFENVRGHVSKGLPDVLEDLAASGFLVEWGCYSAAEVGATHRRDRLWILAHRPGYLADRNRGRLKGERRGGVSDGDAAQRNNADRRGGAPAEVGDADEPRLEGRSEPEQQCSYERPAWPPGPEGDWSGVPRDLWPAVPQSEVCCVADGLPAELVRNRIDKLRAYGNAVVPEVARRAFLELVRRAVARGDDVA